MKYRGREESCFGTIRYIGVPHFSTDKQPLYGIELEGRYGENDGSVDGIRYFECKESKVRHDRTSHFGIFLKAKQFKIWREEPDPLDILQKQQQKQETRQQLRQQISPQIRNDICYGLHEFMATNDIDTDCIEEDMAIFEDEGECNIWTATGHQTTALEVIQSFAKSHRVSSKSFDTGFIFKYEDDTSSDTEEMTVKPHYQSIKEEAVQSGLVSARNFEELVDGKAKRYMKLNKCKQPQGWGEDKYIMEHHLHSLFLYTDFTEFCTEFSSIYRMTSENETTESMIARHSKYYHTARALQQFVEYFGSYGQGGTDPESGPFWCGLNCVLNIPEFVINFNGPTSTTKTKEISISFAGEEGMMMKFNNTKGRSKGRRFLNANWLSTYPEEDERLFIGMDRGNNYPINIESLILILETKNYSLSISAFTKFDSILNGDYGVSEIADSEMDIIRCALESVRGNGREWKECQYLDQYAVDNLYLMTLNKKNIRLYLRDLSKCNQSGFIELFVHSLSASKDEQAMNDETNIIRGDLITLFPNLTAVTVVAGDGYLFSMSRLLDELLSANLPHSLSTVAIECYGDKKARYEWMCESMEGGLKRKAAENNMTLEADPFDWGRIFILRINH